MKIQKTDSAKEITFWEHLEALRWTIFRCLGVLVGLTIVFFLLKDFVFNKIILPPLNSDFYTYRFLCHLGNLLHLPALCPDDFKIQLINIALTGQFMVHMTYSMIMALVAGIPYILYEIWKFVKPALYSNEKKNVGVMFISTSFLFYIGAAVSYFIVFPFTLRFLATYQVSDLIYNQVSIQSYMNTLSLLVIFMGLTFELPVVIYLLSKIGIVNKSMLKSFRRYAFIAVLILAAVITPTSDPFTMMIVATPIYLLYEVSIIVCKDKVKAEDDETETADD